MTLCWENSGVDFRAFKLMSRLVRQMWTGSFILNEPRRFPGPVHVRGNNKRGFSKSQTELPCHNGHDGGRKNAGAERLFWPLRQAEAARKGLPKFQKRHPADPAIAQRKTSHRHW